MRLMALHTMGHDTGVCVFENDHLIFALETERLTRVRHDHQVRVALDHVWEATALRPTDIDFLAFSTNVRNSLARIDNFETCHAAIEAGGLQAESRSEMLGHSIPCLLVAHEASHATLACHHADWVDPCLVLVNEGRGTFSRNACFVYRHGRLDLIDRDALPWYGTGFGWSALGYLLGLGQSPSAAGTAMAMGGYGAHSEGAEALIRGIDATFHHSAREQQRTQAQPLMDYLDRNADFPARADLMRTFQALFTGCVTAYCARQLAAQGCAHLGLGGGCALNLPTNTQLRQQVTPQLAIPPNCNDSGQAIGTALYTLRCHWGARPQPFDVYRCGLPLRKQDVVDALRLAGLQMGPLDVSALAARLADGAVVALAQGVSELGPRALGNRSLLASACRPGMRKRVSERLKGRVWYRPLACIVREERFREIYPGQLASPYMLFSYPVAQVLHAPEATHADGTSRIQTLTRAANPLVWELLRDYEGLTGEPTLINTSLNGPGKPIAYCAQDVLDDFLRRDADVDANTDVDVFVFDDVMAYRT